MRIDPVRCLGPLASWGGLRVWLLACCMLLAGAAFADPGLEVLELQASRDDGVVLDFHFDLTLPRAVDDALRRGIPMYFEARATVARPRWYWRDERVARASKVWRLSYQPLTSSWRVSQGGLHQNYASQAEALALISRAQRWKIADADRLSPDERYYVEFSYQLDTSQLPRPMQIGMPGQSDWTLSFEQTLKLD
jgi:hypothetical protein